MRGATSQQESGKLKMKKYLTKWVFTIDSGKPLTRANSTYTFVSLVRPTKPFVTMMVADEAWVRQNMCNIDLDGMELPEFFTAELKGEEEE